MIKLKESKKFIKNYDKMISNLLAQGISESNSKSLEKFVNRSSKISKTEPGKNKKDRLHS